MLYFIMLDMPIINMALMTEKWFALLYTDTSLSKEEIVGLYGKC